MATAALPLVGHSELADQVRAVEEDGYAYLPAVLDREQVAELRDLMDRIEPSTASLDRVQTLASDGFDGKHIKNSFNRDPSVRQFLDYPGVIELAEALHGDDCHVIAMTSWVTGPGRPDQGLHADWQPLTLPARVMADPEVRIPVFISTTHFYLNDIDEAIGPTRFIPGSHRAGHRPDGATTFNGAEEQSILCSAGDVVTFRSEVWHRGTANRSDRTRYLLQVHYAQRMITQKFPPFLGKFQFDPELLATATQRQLRLLGDHTPGVYD
jgi:ectoine hydroxylase-related dioxygenase (phytanoyl-CoA dioxygenase family)